MLNFCRVVLISVAAIIITKLILNDSASYMFLRKLLSLNFGSKVEPFVVQRNIMAASGNTDWKTATSIYDFTALNIDGEEVSLEKYRGHVSLIVNVASNWGGTKKNYIQLQALHEKYADSMGLRILAFPCNQFGGQEPGTEADIKEFVSKYNVQFDMFSKISVNGDNTHPLWSYLKDKLGGTLGSFIKWNFSKFLVDKNGQPVKRYGPNVDPNAIEPDLLKYFSA